MNKVYGYCRISTPKQNIERQVRNILSLFPQAIIVREVFSGTKYQGRRELEKILAKITSGDTIVFDSVSRMSRNAIEGFKLYEELYDKGVELVFLKERHIDTCTYRQELEKQVNLSITSNDDITNDFIKGIIEVLNKYMKSLAKRQIELAFQQAQKEVDDLHQRTREGIETARRNGKQIGQRKGRKFHIKKKQPIKDIIQRHSRTFGGSLKDKEVIAIINSTPELHVCRNVYYKYKSDLQRTLEL